MNNMILIFTLVNQNLPRINWFLIKIKINHIKVILNQNYKSRFWFQNHDLIFKIEIMPISLHDQLLFRAITYRTWFTVGAGKSGGAFCNSSTPHFNDIMHINKDFPVVHEYETRFFGEISCSLIIKPLVPSIRFH